MDFLPLSPRARLLFHLQALMRFALFWVPVCGVGAAVGSAMWWPAGAMGLAGVLLFLQFVVAIWYPSFAFDRWGYALSSSELLVRRGVFFRSITAIPVDRVQHVDMRQGPIEQWFGIARVRVYTASGVGGDGVVPGLELAVATDLRDQLVKLTGVDDGV